MAVTWPVRHTLSIGRRLPASVGTFPTVTKTLAAPRATHRHDPPRAHERSGSRRVEAIAGDAPPGGRPGGRVPVGAVAGARPAVPDDHRGPGRPGGVRA